MRPPPFEQDDRIDHIPKTNNLKPKIWVVLKSQQNVCPNVGGELEEANLTSSKTGATLQVLLNLNTCNSIPSTQPLTSSGESAMKFITRFAVMSVKELGLQRKGSAI